MHVLKFGGTSMGDADTWQRVLDIIARYKHPFVIVSATARTTRHLLAAAEKAVTDLEEAIHISQQIHHRHHQIITNFLDNYPEVQPAITQECTQWIDDTIDELDKYLRGIHESRELTASQRDAVASVGERLSSYLFARCGTAAGLTTTWVDASDFIHTNSDFGQAVPDEKYINQKIPQWWNHRDGEEIPVMGGYYGKDTNGHLTTLGFEGSDYTASLVGAALAAESIEIWTDVSGIYTCDPQVVPQAQPIAELSFREATEMAYFGAKVLHPSTTKPASAKRIPVWVKNIFEPQQRGTRISHETHPDGDVKAMTFKKNCVVITVTSSQTVMGYEFLSGVFDILRHHHLPVDVVTTTEASVSIVMESAKRVNDAVERLASYGTVEVVHQQGIISLVGCRTNNTISLVNEILRCLEGPSANLVSYNKGKGNLNIVLREELLIQSVKAIHKHIFE